MNKNTRRNSFAFFTSGFLGLGDDKLPQDMPDEKPLTKSDLVAVLKEWGVATKVDIQETEKRLNERISSTRESLNQNINAVEKRLNERTAATEERLKSHITDVVVESNQAIIAGVEALQAEVNARFDKVDDEIKKIKDDLSDKVTRAEFNELEERVDQYHPSH